MIRVYAYKGCDSCRKALKWLRERDVEFEEVAIRETAPSFDELREMLGMQGGELRRLFNTAGGDYRSMGLKDRLPGMATDDALGLLAGHGNLVKRPFAIGDGVGLLGFKPVEWEAALG